MWVGVVSARRVQRGHQGDHALVSQAQCEHPPALQGAAQGDYPCQVRTSSIAGCSCEPSEAGIPPRLAPGRPSTRQCPSTRPAGEEACARAQAPREKGQGCRRVCINPCLRSRLLYMFMLSMDQLTFVKRLVRFDGQQNELAF
ncbi:hypothetical protein RSAG8_11623, partial [Rhizoctonia solani AG-8 WAC10335]